MKIPLKIVIALALFLAVIQSYRVIESAGLLYAIEPHFSGQCEAVYGTTGAEDITIDQTRQYAYISADDRRATIAKKPINGGIYGLDISKSDAVPILLTKGFSKDFHPHGISLYQNPHGEQSLFVINHLRSGQNQVEIFDINGVGELSHRVSISYPELQTPNDLVAVGASEFYATNDHGYPHGSFMAMMEDYLGLALSNISYFDGESGRIVASGLMYGNGMAVSPDTKTMYVAEIMGRKINIFDRNLLDGSLTKLDEIAVNSGADNLEWDERGNLWFAGHPRLLEFAGHAESAENISPSQVMKINVKAEPPSVSEVYMNLGDEISASSVAAVSGNLMLIGSVFEEHILRCKL